MNRISEVAKAPPKRFSGGGYWEAMHGILSGWFELRVDGPARTHYRFFCRIDLDAEGYDHPLLVVIAGLVKPFRGSFSTSEYLAIRNLGIEYFSENPRRIAVD